MNPDADRLSIDADPFAYPAAPLRDSENASPPAYESALQWMREISGRSASLDFWARGNYARRLIENRRKSIRPLLIPVETVAEMRWAYRRMALLGCHTEFLWQGPLSPPLRLIHLHPGNPNDRWDAGWGYVAFLTKKPALRTSKRDWYPVVGNARLLPEEVPAWLVTEAPGAFASGEVFVTPAELVGISSSGGESEVFESVTGAIPLKSDPAADALLNIQLPGLDHLSPGKFAKLLADNPLELERLRTAFRKLIAASDFKDLPTLVAELNYETSELTLADRFQGFRARIARLGGVIATTAAAVGATVGATSGDLATALAASAGSVAAAGLCECLSLRAEHRLELRRNPLFLLWQLGSQKGQRLSAANLPKHRLQQRKVASISSTEDGYFHWLAPPSAGVKLAGIRKKESDRSPNTGLNRTAPLRGTAG